MEKWILIEGGVDYSLIGIGMWYKNGIYGEMKEWLNGIWSFWKMSQIPNWYKFLFENNVV